MNKCSQFKVAASFLLACALFQASPALSQRSRTRAFGELTGPEKWWVVTHVFSASRVYELSREASEVTRELVSRDVLDGDYQGGQADAFRHAYWMARLAREFPERAVRKLGNAHERGNYIDHKKGRLEDGAVADRVSGEMDLWNNRVGREIGMQATGKTSAELAEEVLKALRDGRLRMIRKNEKGKYLDAEGRVIPDHLLGEWENPKTLVPSRLN